MEETTPIKFYGTVWCLSSRRAKNLLTAKGIEFEWINIDDDEEGRAFVEKVNNGYRSVPTIVFSDGDILVEPSMVELEEKLATLR